MRSNRERQPRIPIRCAGPARSRVKKSSTTSYEQKRFSFCMRKEGISVIRAFCWTRNLSCRAPRKRKYKERKRKTPIVTKKKGSKNKPLYKVVQNFFFTLRPITLEMEGAETVVAAVAACLAAADCLVRGRRQASAADLSSRGRGFEAWRTFRSGLAVAQESS